MAYTSIRPGQIWLDTNGKRIQAHAGNIWYEDGVYYWYGENKEFTDGKSKIWTWGIRYYSSTDLYNWKDEGLLIAPEPKDKKSPLHPNRKLDRPHIIKNAKTGKYVCWIKYCDKPEFSILAADAFRGPYTLVRSHYKPFGKKVGDFDLTVDETTGKAYLYVECDHKDLISCELTEDYLAAADTYKMHYENVKPPFTREGVTHFVRNGRHYLLTSGMTGYIPNPSEVAVSDDWQGPYMVQGNPHINDDSSASFNSQISGVFKHPKMDLYIALADRWVPDYPVDRERYEWLKRVIGSNYNKEYKSTIKEKMQLMKTPLMASANTSIADYVWLPIRFDGDRAYIEWHEEWKIEEI